MNLIVSHSKILSKFHLLCFVSMTFSGSLCASSKEIDVDRKIAKDKYKRLIVQAQWFINTLTKEQSSVAKRRASVKMSLTQNTMTETLIH